MLRISYVNLLIVIGLAVRFAAGADEPPVDYARDIQPILEAHCLKCHGPQKQTSGYRLDVRSLALAGGESGETAIVAGKSGESSLVQRVRSDDPDLMMPPEGQRLTVEQVALLERWIDQGAAWPDKLSGEELLSKKHWAYEPPVRPELPPVKIIDWVRNPIDRFVLAKLETEGLTPSPAADDVSLLRRASLDLIGLPPSIQEIDAFATASSADAYEQAVEKLLGSVHYGERWGRVWLDAARYADSNGFEKDRPRQAWFYRDWVIGALNRDLPYDQFIIEQIAGDQMPDATQDRLVATGFLRNSMLNEEGGIDPEQFRMEAMFDRMDALGKAILGLTIQCAQCHSHKYDPLTQEEYYRMFAFINDAHEAIVAVYTHEEQMRRAEMFGQIAEIEADLKRRTPDWPARMAEWESRVRDDQPRWTILRPAVDEDSTAGQSYLPQDDGSFLVQGDVPPKFTVIMTVSTDMPRVGAFRLELLTDPNLPLGGPGRSIHGTAALTEFEVEAAPVADAKQTKKIKFKRATADVNPPETPLAAIYDDKSGKRRVTGPITFAIDAKEGTAWGIDLGPGRRNQPRKAVFVPETPIENSSGTVLKFYLSQQHGGWNSSDNQILTIGRLRLSITDATDATADPLPAEVRAILAMPAEKRSPRQLDALFSYWRTTVPQWQAENARIEQLWAKHPEGASQLALVARDQPRPTSVLKRGDFLQPGRQVAPGVPRFLHSLPDAVPPTRLSFARWLVDRRSPTTARAIVNRIWQAYFGVGLVSTSEDLGVKCDPPSHPELLDWLAVELMESRWSLKHLHRLIVTSATYRQSSNASSELLRRDPYNRLLARGPRFRVDAELVRDIGLSASGLINLKVGGPGIYPPAPEFLFQPPASYGTKVWNVSTGEDRYRRAVYTFRYRTAPYPMLQTFDASNGEASCVRRSRSNTPLQALVTLNEPLAVECAQALARRIVVEGGASTRERLTYAFRCCVARAPTEAEESELSRFYREQKERIAAGWLNAWQLIGSADKLPPPTPKGSSPTELAAWTAVARVLLNLDETITKP